MKKEIVILWIASFVITFVVIYLTNLFSKDYPISGTIGIEGKKVSYRFEKVHYGKDDVTILIRSDIKNLTGKVFWKSPNDSSWLSINMIESDLILSAKFPSLKADHKLQYYIELFYKDKKYSLPDNQKVEMKFWGKIPSMLKALQFILLNLGLLLSVRVGLEYFNPKEKIKKFEVFVTLIFLTLTLLVNPLYLSYKYGYINSSIPSIDKLFPFKELSISALWILTIILTFNLKKYKPIPLVSAVITILIFIIFY